MLDLGSLQGFHIIFVVFADSTDIVARWPSFTTSIIPTEQVEESDPLLI